MDLIGPLLHFPGIYNIGGGKEEGEEYDRERSFPLESSSSLEALFSLDFLEGTEGTFPPSNPPLPPPPLALRPNTPPFRGGVGDEAGWWWLLFTSPLSIPITLKLSINLTVKRFKRGGENDIGRRPFLGRRCHGKGGGKGKGRRKFSPYKPCFTASRHDPTLLFPRFVFPLCNTYNSTLNRYNSVRRITIELFRR